MSLIPCFLSECHIDRKSIKGKTEICTVVLLSMRCGWKLGTEMARHDSDYNSGRKGGKERSHFRGGETDLKVIQEFAR